MTRRRVIVLRVITDDPALTWWEALGLPDPDSWSLSDTFRASVFPQVVLEVEESTDVLM